MMGIVESSFYFFADVLCQIGASMVAGSVPLLLLFVVAFVCSWDYEGDEAPAPYRFRTCEGLRWKRHFPQAPKDEIRRFLSIFVNSFGFREKDRLKFGPDDRILDVYHAVYRPMPSVDNMELEEFFCRVEDTYGIDSSQLWNGHLTLGELFVAAVSGKR